jgi:hypothetical protein
MLKYDLEYFELMLRQNSKTAEEICQIRWKWIEQINPKIVLDYGSGVGWFRAWRPQGVEVFTYDIGKYPQTGIKLKIYDIVCFWDVLEHIEEFKRIEPILRIANHVALSIPLLIDEQQLSIWKHFKPGEHLHYWNQRTLDAFFEKYGFELLKKGNPECPPRVDIGSFLYERRR